MARHDPTGFVLTAAAAAVLALTPGCNLSGPADAGSVPDGDAAGHDAEAEGSAGDAGEDGARPDGDEEAGPGPLTLVVSQMAMVTDRRCDFDGDGVGDNSVADLGTPGATLFATALSATLQGSVDGGSRFLFHFPWLEDAVTPSDPDTVGLMFAGFDTDVEIDGEDDFSGSEPFYVTAPYLDECGEPLFVADHAAIDGEGRLRHSGEAIPFFSIEEAEGAAFRQYTIDGTFAPGGESFELFLCGVLLASDLAATPGPVLTGEEDISYLEVLLTGGSAFGVPSVPGLSPDVDADGDGLEHFVLDDDGRLERCADGDGTVIEGPGCWRDARIADGFSIAVEMTALQASFAGRKPGWEYEEYERGIDCDTPPGDSLFDNPTLGPAPACAELDEPCEPLATDNQCCDPDHVCSGANTVDYRCFARCTAVGCSRGTHRGFCRAPSNAGAGLGLCIHLWTDPQSVECTPGETGCTTAYGVSEGTYCSDWGDEYGTTCLEVCAAPGDQCPDALQWCAPLVFEPDGSLAADGAGVCVGTPP